MHMGSSAAADYTKYAGHGGPGGHGGESSVCSMNMHFTWETTDLCVIFKWWHVRTQIGLMMTLAAIMSLSAGYEYLRYQIRRLDNEACNSPIVANSASMSRSMKLKQSAGYAFQVGYSYLLMLVFMSYNGWAMISVAVGAGIGFWFWGDRAQRGMSCH